MKKIYLDIASDLFMSPAKLGITFKPTHLNVAGLFLHPVLLFNASSIYCCQWRQPLKELPEDFGNHSSCTNFKLFCPTGN